MAVDLSLAMIAATVKIEQAQPGGNLSILGTGFLVNDPKPDGAPRIVLVTANHVFQNMPGQVASIDYRLPQPGGAWKLSPQPLPIRSGPSLLWVKDPVEDVAVIAVQAPPEFARAAIPLSWLADAADYTDLGIQPGDEMFALGYPDNYASNHEDFPILSAGHVASYPLVTVPTYLQFMLDARTYPGNSGGPVFLASPLQRRPGSPLAGSPYVTGMVVSVAEKYQWAFVVESTAIRRAIAELDRAPAAAAPDAQGFTLLPAQPARP